MTNKFKYMYRRLVLGVFVVISAITIAAPSYAKPPVKWPTVKFKVVHDNPTSINPLTGQVDKYKDQLIESYLERVGTTYHGKGFLAPKLPIKLIDGEKFYIVNLSDLADTKKAATTYAPNKNAPEGLMVLDTSRIYSNQPTGLSPFGYTVLGHELFHAIQNGYSIKQKHYLGTWITEGTAQAVGMDMFFTHAPKAATSIKLNASFDPLRRWGGRNYFKPLRVKHGDAVKKYSKTKLKAHTNNGYESSSLWRYIDEYIRTSGSPSLKPPKNPDYSYLADFFARPLPNGKTREERELKWLDENLKQHPKIKRPLSLIYARHITDLAHYIPDRTGEYPLHKGAYADADSIGIWEKHIFDSCEKVTLTASQPSVDISVSFAKVSARCIEVFFEGSPKNISVKFALPEANKEVANSLRTIGVQAKLPGGASQIRIEPVSNFTKIDGSPGAQWMFKNLPFVKRSPREKRSNVFILSNVADNAATTDELKDVKIKITYPFSKGQMNSSKTGK